MQPGDHIAVGFGVRGGGGNRLDATHSPPAPHRLLGPRSHSRAHSRALQADDPSLTRRLLRAGGSDSVGFVVFIIVVFFFGYLKE